MTTAEERAIFGFAVVDWMLAVVQLIKRLDSNVCGYKGCALTPHRNFFLKGLQTNQHCHDKLQQISPTSAWINDDQKKKKRKRVTE